MRRICFRRNLSWCLFHFVIKEGKANINQKDRSGRTLLMENINRPSVMELLISLGADVNLLDNDGLSALYHAMEVANKETVEVLLRAGAKLPQTDKKGKIVSFTWGSGVERTAKEKLEVVKLIESYTDDNTFICNEDFFSSILHGGNKNDEKVWLKFIKDENLADKVIIRGNCFWSLQRLIENSSSEQIKVFLQSFKCFDFRYGDRTSRYKSAWIEPWQFEELVSQALEKRDKETTW